MGAGSNIEWTNATWNPLVGCSKVSPGCANCYAETMAARLKAMALADIKAGRDPGRKRHYIEAVDERGRWSGKVVPVPEALEDPLKWKRPRMIFVNSMSDLFHEDVPFEFIDKVFAVMALAQQHTFQILTKRANRMLDYISGDFRAATVSRKACAVGRGTVYMGWPLQNVWLGVSVEGRKHLPRIDALRAAPAAARFLSLEPLLEDLGRIDLRGIHWVIVGGESGAGARPMHVEWARSLVRQCKSAGVNCFVKQLGARPRGCLCRKQLVGGLVHTSACCEQRFEDKKGGDMEEWPEDLRVRQMPAAEKAVANK